MYVLYTAGLIGWLVIFLPFFAYQRWVRKRSLGNLWQKLGRIPPEAASDGRPTIWVHSTSLGETLAAGPIIQGLHQRFPGHRIVATVITATGYAIARSRFPAYGPVFYFPVDLPGVIRKVLGRVRPRIVVILETEIWPNFVHQCALQNIPVIMVNGRISPVAYRKYRRVRRLLRPILAMYHLLIMKSEEDAAHIRGMGAPPERVRVSGNIKFDRDNFERPIAESTAAELDARLGLSQGSPVIVAGSTHPNEEATLLAAFQQLRATPGIGPVRLLLAPRHPERFDSMAALVERMGFRLGRRSVAGPADPAAEVILLDTIGELGTAYQFARLVFVGGTIAPKGGHSIMEPALFAKPIVIGPHMENFPGIIDDFLQARALVQLPDATEERTIERLAATWAELLHDPAQCAELGRRALAVFDGNRGATQRTLDWLSEVIAADPRGAQPEPSMPQSPAAPPPHHRRAPATTPEDSRR